MMYSLWDIETNNLIAEFDNRRAALAFVLDGIRRHGAGDVDALSLDVEDDDGQVRTIAAGRSLARLASTELDARIAI